MKIHRANWVTIIRCADYIPKGWNRLKRSSEWEKVTCRKCLKKREKKP